MKVTWQSSPGGLAALFARMKKGGAGEQGWLTITLDEPAALGRLTLRSPEGRELYALVDSIVSADKVFLLSPERLVGGFVLTDREGRLLFDSAAEAEPPAVAEVPALAEAAQEAALAEDAQEAAPAEAVPEEFAGTEKAEPPAPESAGPA